MALDPSVFEATVIAAVILAGAARVLIPYLAKRQSDISAGLTPRPFSISYIITGALAIIPIAVGAILLLPTIMPAVNNTGSQLMVFVTAFGIAYATTDIVNRNVSSLETKPPITTTRATETNLRIASDVDAHPTSGQPTEKE